MRKRKTIKPNMRVNLIHNPGSGGQTKADAEMLTDLIRRAGHEVTYQSSDNHEWPVSVDLPCDLVVVAGGDGTSGRIAKRLVGRGIPMTFLPLGTANNISKSFGLSHRPLAELIAGWSQPRSHWIDVGVIDSPWGSSYFIEGVGMGLFVNTMIEIDARDALGHLESPEEKIVHALRILGRRLQQFPARRLSLTLDDKDLSGDYIMLEVMNIRYVGPNLYIAPASDPTDGMLDVVLITERERDELARSLTHWRRGVLNPPALPTHRGRKLRIEGQGDVLHVDDEAWPPADVSHRSVSGPIEITTLSRALEVLVPHASSQSPVT